MPTCLELPGRAHPASGWRDLSWPSGVQQYSFSFLFHPGCLLWSHGAGVWIRSLPQAPVGSPCPHARMVPTDLPDCPPAQTPAHGASLPAPAPAWARMTHSVCLAGRVGSESREPAKHGAVCSQRGLRSRRGYWGCWAVPGRARPQAPASALPTQPSDGCLSPHKRLAEAAGTFFLPLDPTLCPQSPSLCPRPRKASGAESRGSPEAGSDPSLPRTSPPAPWGRRM